MNGYQDCNIFLVLVLGSFFIVRWEFLALDSLRSSKFSAHWKRECMWMKLPNNWACRWKKSRKSPSLLMHVYRHAIYIGPFLFFFILLSCSGIWQNINQISWRRWLGLLNDWWLSFQVHWQWLISCLCEVKPGRNTLLSSNRIVPTSPLYSFI